jgi:DNA-binding NtrC family response regulator
MGGMAMANNIQLLIVDDEVRFLRTLKERLQLRGFDVTAVTSGTQAIEAARGREFDVALLDLKMPGMDGEEVLRTLKSKHPLLEVIILTGHGSVESAVDCTKAGSYSYLQKPCETGELLEVLKNAYQKRVQRKLALDEEKMGQLLQVATGESALGILRRLRQIEETADRSDS